MAAKRWWMIYGNHAPYTPYAMCHAIEPPIKNGDGWTSSGGPFVMVGTSTGNRWSRKGDGKGFPVDVTQFVGILEPDDTRAYA